MYTQINSFYPTSNPNPLTKEFIVEPQLKRPFIKFNEQKGFLMIKGNSMEVKEEFFLPVLALIEEHLKHNNKLTCYFFFKCFNQETTNVLFKVFQTLENHKQLGHKITINWFSDFENENMIETGIGFADLFDLKFNIQPV